MRPDGRNADELRPVTFTPHFSSYAEGSVVVAFGRTQVLCNVTIESGVPRWMQVQNRPGGWVTGEYAMLPRATQQRTPRETNGVGGRTHEIRRLIGRGLRMSVDLNKLGPRTCIIDCDVLQADGGTRTAAITGGYTALALALGHLQAKGLVPADALHQPVAAVSAGIVNGEPRLDLCYAEDSQAEVDANFVMNGAGEFIEVQLSAEGRPFSRQQMDALLELASRGARQLLDLQQKCLENAGKGTGGGFFNREGW